MAGALVLGPVVFQAFEIPERLEFGGRQRLAVHVLPGGGRVVDAMGADEGPVAWSGAVSGPDAGVRVRILEGLRRSGAAVPLAWEGWLYSVIVERFDVRAESAAWMPYSLRACVVQAGDVAASLVDGVLAAGAGDEAAYGGVTGTDEQIAAAAGALQSGVPVVAMGAAGMLARMVAGNALAGVLR